MRTRLNYLLKSNATVSVSQRRKLDIFQVPEVSLAPSPFKTGKHAETGMVAVHELFLKAFYSIIVHKSIIRYFYIHL